VCELSYEGTYEGQRRTQGEKETEEKVESSGRIYDGEWLVTAVTTTETLRHKWGALLPQWRWSDIGEEDWPSCIIGKGNEMAKLIGESQRTPEWVVVDGGEFHRTAVNVLKARRLKKWGVRGSLSLSISTSVIS